MKPAGLLFLVIILGATAFIFKDNLLKPFFTTRKSDLPTGATFVTNSPGINTKAEKDVEVIAQNLDTPWEIAFLPDASMLVTERPGKLIKIDKVTKVIEEISGVKEIGEG